ncbi:MULTISPECIES: exodeoxyribonuclease VII large subunit [unclassified Enterococcus]|uniref:exodeoxyribonuclease VII large subunit n=1 Tax=unclassified Enterococcus TaxID=2608891 RepID=UPI0015575043|nr:MULTISPECIES: exodeoxyribonuclease VII large subunit [unclassified Enterococcus]MBS7575986.1 exodeoxyribonuclease VII large subunit [Enterococcus sp. MMGLQ5-2]MBS7583219.1 exodeoxyribonuclease VII large subunit [Enterococcus sp. MMGLQ5-1]NPD11079.1 exodeoxyribonuclease VII large subunit [Enterococcus sp. MMGLQ5-1]NPD35822.1 exodeoxyribonuclease VII large subunit [Enterococcus sp. MMGLQ5-2]
MEYLSVTTLTKYLKAKFDRDPYLETVYLTGEISNFRKRPTHQYFSLKDDGAVINATMFAGKFRQLKFQPENGMKVLVVGRLTLYEKSGQYQIVLEEMIPDGVGALFLQFNQLKAQLSKAGLFQEQFKQAIPAFPKVIGVITSPSGAVIRDIITTVERRFPLAKILLFPTKVQGVGAKEEIVKNIQRANQMSEIDVLIVGRGGGSIEDLWAFNEESVVRAIFESKLPIISSVGHETDTTLADFVSDRRAATPTAAAEIATPNMIELINLLQRQDQRLTKVLQNQISQYRLRANQLAQSVIFRQPMRLYDGHLQKVDYLSEKLTSALKERLNQQYQMTERILNRLAHQSPDRAIKQYLQTLAMLERQLNQAMRELIRQKQNKAANAIQALDLLSPLKVMLRGFSITENETGQVIRKADAINIGDQMLTRLPDGKLISIVQAIEKSKEGE